MLRMIKVVSGSTITGVIDATLNFAKSFTSCDFCAADKLSPVVLLIDMKTLPYSGTDYTPSDGSKLPSSPPNTETACVFGNSFFAYTA